MTCRFLRCHQGKVPSRHRPSGFSVKYWRYLRSVREYSSTSDIKTCAAESAGRGDTPGDTLLLNGSLGVSGAGLSAEDDSIQATMVFTDLPLHSPGVPAFRVMMISGRRDSRATQVGGEVAPWSLTLPSTIDYTSVHAVDARRRSRWLV